MPRLPMKACGRSLTLSTPSSRTARRSTNIRRCRCFRRTARPTPQASISSKPCFRASSRAAPRARSGGCRRTSPARPTTEDAVDGWFVGFTNDITIAVWVGYDNGDGKRRSLGSNETGARVALPIFKPIIEAIWAQHIAPKVPLNGPSREAQRMLVDMPIDYMSGDPLNRPPPNNDGNGFAAFFGANANANSIPHGGGSFIEHFRRSPDGQVADTQYQLVSSTDAYSISNDQQQYQQQWGDQGYSYGPQGNDGRWTSGRTYDPNRGWQSGPPQQPQPVARGLFGAPPPPQQPAARGLFGLPLFGQPAARDPNYSWGGRYN